MRAIHGFVTLLVTTSVFGCTPELPESRFVCSTNADCPRRWSCDPATSLCVSREVDANVVEEEDANMCVPNGDPDEPDVSGIDANCDGVDGLVTDAVFVDGAAGDDSADGGRATPLATIPAALAKAMADGKHHVLVSSGTYSANVTLVDGISIHGGYERSQGWRRAALTATPTTIITSASSPTVLGASLVMPMRITGVRIQGPDVVATGTSSIALRLVDVSDLLVIEHAVIDAGVGAGGVPGTTPTTVPLGGNTGANGEPGVKHPTTSFVGTSFVATPGPCYCTRGGIGAFSWANPASNRVGLDGERFDDITCVTVVNDGLPSAGGASTANAGLPGTPGAPGLPGAPGAAGGYAAAVTEAGYVPTTGGTGAEGRGGGGGGGGASGAVKVCGDGDNLLGATGAHGGSGGCGGLGGTGGGGGGASIGVYLWRSTPTFISVTVFGDVGGVGGAGALGVAGASGGMGGSAISPTISCAPLGLANAGGSGGQGGTGGQGGRGGGGAGGLSAGMVFGTDASLSASSNGVVFSIGTGGSGGEGGNQGPAGPSCGVYRASDGACLPTLP